MASDIEQLIRSPLAMQIAIHYGLHPSRSWPEFDYPGKHFPSQADCIHEYVRRGLLVERTDPDHCKFRSRYEATDQLRIMVQGMQLRFGNLMDYTKAVA